MSDPGAGPPARSATPPGRSAEPPDRSAELPGPRGGGLPVLALGSTVALALATLGWVPGARGTPLPSFLLWSVAYAAFLGAAWLQRTRPIPRSGAWIVGVAMRAALIPLAPHYSDDLYRYLWDGVVQLRGVNPYLHAPADPAVADPGTWFHALVNHPEIPTIYPPGAQAAFFGLAAVAASAPLFKAAWVACDLGVAWLVDRLAGAGARSRPGVDPPDAVAGAADEGVGGGAARRPSARAASLPLLLYLWCPLPVLEVAWSGHLEPLGVLPLLAACAVLRAGDRGILAGALVGAAAAVKLAPLATVPALLRRHGWLAAGAAVALPLLLYLPYAEAGTRLFEGLATYARSWEFNPGPYSLLEAIAGSGAAARAIAGLGVAAVAGLAAWRRWPLSRAAFGVLGAGILLSPTVHPWYLLWVLPFAALYRSRAWILFGGLAFLAYWGHDAYRATGAWPHPAWLTVVIWGPFLALLVRDALHRLRPGRGPA